MPADQLAAVTDLQAVRQSLWTGRHLRTTIGVVALAFLFAFEALAVATVMPRVAQELDGLSWYGAAFAAPLASSVVAYALAGPWIDRQGTRPAIAIGVAVFCVGVLIAGLAASMPVLILGRLVQGFGAGACGVAIYVVVAQTYDETLRPAAFAALSAAWVLPGLAGPLLVGAVADAVGWRWIFLAVPAIALPAWWLIRDAPGKPSGADAVHSGRMLGWAVLAAVGVLAVSIAGQRALAGWPVLIALGIAVVLVAGPRLLPRGTWVARRGMPSAILTRGLLFSAYSVAEVYVPLLLRLERGLSLSQAGAVLTGAALTWFLGSWLAARAVTLGDSRVWLGAAISAIGIAGFASVVVPAVPTIVPMLSWAIAGFGIGLLFATISDVALQLAPKGTEGAASAALQLDDALLVAFGTAISGAAFAGFADAAPTGAATVLVLAAAGMAATALVPARRLR
jgi:MFS family permease